MLPTKIISDQAKLLVESKIVLNDFVLQCPITNHKLVTIYSLQISCNDVHIIKLKLVDNGLYVATRLASLTIPKLPLQFAENAEQWFADLLHFKIHTQTMLQLSQEMDKDKRVLLKISSIILLQAHHN